MMSNVKSVPSAKTRDSLTTQRRYDRQAALFDLMEAPLEALVLGGLRRRLWSDVRESRVLEIGVGTGKNMPYHSEGTRAVAVDISPQMLARHASRGVSAFSSPSSYCNQRSA